MKMHSVRSPLIALAALAASAMTSSRSYNVSFGTNQDLGARSPGKNILTINDGNSELGGGVNMVQASSMNVDLQTNGGGTGYVNLGGDGAGTEFGQRDASMESHGGTPGQVGTGNDTVT